MLKIRTIKRGRNDPPYHLLEGRLNRNLPQEAQQAKKLWQERQAAIRSGQSANAAQTHTRDQAHDHEL